MAETSTAAQRPGPAEFGLLALLALAWGTAFFFIEVALPTVPPVTINLGRMAVAAFCLFLLVQKQKLAFPKPGPVWGYLAAVAVLGNALPYFLIAYAQQTVDSGLAAILIGATPLITMAFAHFVTPDEKMTWSKLGGLLLGLLGLVALFGPGALAGLGSDLGAQGLLLAACVSFACNALVARRMPHLPLLVSGFGMTLFGSAILFPFAVAGDPGLDTSPDWQAIGAIVALGVIGTAGATLLFFTLVRRVGATFVASANYLTPPIALTLGTLLLGERLRPEALVALALICAGIWLANRR